MEEGAPPGEAVQAATQPVVDDKKIIHTYPLVKTCDMPEEMWGEVVELVVAGCEKYAYNYELASKLIKQGLDQRFGPPWNIVVGEAYGYHVSYLVGSLMFMYTGDVDEVFVRQVPAKGNVLNGFRGPDIAAPNSTVSCTKWGPAKAKIWIVPPPCNPFKINGNVEYFNLCNKGIFRQELIINEEVFAF